MQSLLGLARMCTCHPSSFWRTQNPSQKPTIILPDNHLCDASSPICLELDEKKAGAEHYSPLVEEEVNDEASDVMVDKALDRCSLPKKEHVDMDVDEVKCRASDLPVIEEAGAPKCATNG